MGCILLSHVRMGRTPQAYRLPFASILLVSAARRITWYLTPENIGISRRALRAQRAAHAPGALPLQDRLLDLAYAECQRLD